MDTFKLIYGVDMPDNPKALVIGAGGIGCELLKNLAMTGFKDIEVIDLDTIDISNLNRQFLFTRDDVGKPKSEVAAKAISNRFPTVSIKSHVGNIKDPQFRSDFFKQFDIIFNALDNIEARKHVSRVCIALSKPLIDGGSTGFVGTTVSIVKDKTPCYECYDKPTPKQFPVCTIRSTPDKMIHCIVWAKLLLSALFGPAEEVNFLEDIREELADIVKKRDHTELSETVFKRVFDTEIHTQIALLEKKKEGKTEGLDEEAKKIVTNLLNRQLTPLDTEKCKEQLGKTEYLDADGHRQDTETWDVDKYTQLFFASIKGVLEQQSDMIGMIEFDKDNDVLLDFVIAASNLRAHNYSIQMESGFKIKEMAGNIIPAVSSTNGLVAGFETVEGLKILAQQYDDLKSITFSGFNDRRKIARARLIGDINPNCVVCSNVSLQAKLTVDPENFKLEDLISKIFYKELAISTASIECNGNILYESGADLDEEDVEVYNAKLPKLLIELGIKAGDTIYVDDFSQDFKCYIEIHYSFDVVKDDEKYPNGYELIYLNKGTTKPIEEETKINLAQEAGSSTEVGGDDGIELVHPGDLNQKVSSKRKSSNLPEIENTSKRSNQSAEERDPIDID